MESEGSFEGKPSPVKAIDHEVVQKEKEKYENELGWTLEKPKDGDYRGILLSSDPPSISEIAERFTNSDFIIEDFELGSPHSWRRMF